MPGRRVDNEHWLRRTDYARPEPKAKSGPENPGERSEEDDEEEEEEEGAEEGRGEDQLEGDGREKVMKERF